MIENDETLSDGDIEELQDLITVLENEVKND